MIKIFGLTTIAVATVLLTGCGGGGSNDNTPNIIETAHSKLIGTWIDGTVNDGCETNAYSATSEKTILTFVQNDLTVEDLDYNNTTCNPSGLVKDVVETYEYSIEGTDKATTGQTSYKMSVTKTEVDIKKGTVTDPEILQTGDIIKLEFLFDNKAHLVFAEKAESKSQYSNDFNLSEYLIKLP